MRFLEINEIAEWFREGGEDLEKDWQPPDRATPPTQILRYGQVSGAQPDREVLETALAALEGWDDCLLWITQWGVCPSGEDWPLFYAARGKRDFRRSLETAPGHLFASDEAADLQEFLGYVLQNAWDAWIFVRKNGAIRRSRAFVSHDEYVDLWLYQNRSSST